MTNHYPVVLEHEPNGTVSAYVVGLPGVFAAADSEAEAARALRSALKSHLIALNRLQGRVSTKATVRVARITYRRGRPCPTWDWLGSEHSWADAAAPPRPPRRGSTAGRAGGLGSVLLAKSPFE